ncbi:Poly(ADP-ribose) glycohydrolase [Labeo rohita]|uniref:poly(ADP-ribose) glycohydrolase n=1 Tax=Labeo rohita TaxID=84645 RepID=A0ABQ8M5M6_LABRO|nr:Poly(ADP-ribose) glycohydrolase [Labeo rohita]
MSDREPLRKRQKLECESLHPGRTDDVEIPQKTAPACSDRPEDSSKLQRGPQVPARDSRCKSFRTLHDWLKPAVTQKSSHHHHHPEPEESEESSRNQGSPGGTDPFTVPPPTTAASDGEEIPLTSEKKSANEPRRTGSVLVSDPDANTGTRKITDFFTKAPGKVACRRIFFDVPHIKHRVKNKAATCQNKVSSKIFTICNHLLLNRVADLGSALIGKVEVKKTKVISDSQTLCFRYRADRVPFREVRVNGCESVTGRGEFGPRSSVCRSVRRLLFVRDPQSRCEHERVLRAAEDARFRVENRVQSEELRISQTFSQIRSVSLADVIGGVVFLSETSLRPASPAGADGKPLIGNVARLGVSLSDLRRAPACSGPLPALKPTDSHTVMIRTDLLQSGGVPEPYPSPDELRDCWDDAHVKMPFSKHSLFPMERTTLQSRWDLINKALSVPFSSSHDVKDAILTYNAGQAKRWNFTALHMPNLYLPNPMSTSEATAIVESFVMRFDGQVQFDGREERAGPHCVRFVDLKSQLAAVLLSGFTSPPTDPPPMRSQIDQSCADEQQVSKLLWFLSVFLIVRSLPVSVLFAHFGDQDTHGYWCLLLFRAFVQTYFIIKEMSSTFESLWRLSHVIVLIESLDRPCFSSLCVQPIPLLRTQRCGSITLSQEQVSCLLANAFFCTFPRRNSRRTEFSNYPDINFSRCRIKHIARVRVLFEGSSQRKQEKLKTLLWYFKRITQRRPNGLITYTRQCLQSLPSWSSSEKQFSKLHISCDGTIEDQGYGMLQVDFANRFVGGGVTGSGLVQEEIRFLINPELIAARLFTEALDDNECLIITGRQTHKDTLRFLWCLCSDCADKDALAAIMDYVLDRNNQACIQTSITHWENLSPPLLPHDFTHEFRLPLEELTVFQQHWLKWMCQHAPPGVISPIPVQRYADDVQIASREESVIKNMLVRTDAFLEWSGLEIKDTNTYTYHGHKINIAGEWKEQVNIILSEFTSNLDLTDKCPLPLTMKLEAVRQVALSKVQHLFSNVHIQQKVLSEMNNKTVSLLEGGLGEPKVTWIYTSMRISHLLNMLNNDDKDVRELARSSLFLDLRRRKVKEAEPHFLGFKRKPSGKLDTHSVGFDWPDLNDLCVLTRASLEWVRSDSESVRVSEDIITDPLTKVRARATYGAYSYPLASVSARRALLELHQYHEKQHWTGLKLQGKLACLSSADHSVSHSFPKNTALSEDIVIFTVRARLQVLPTRLNLSMWFPTTQVPYCLHHTTEQITETLPHMLNGCYAYNEMYTDRIVDISKHLPPVSFCFGLRIDRDCTASVFRALHLICILGSAAQLIRALRAGWSRSANARGHDISFIKTSRPLRFALSHEEEFFPAGMRLSHFLSNKDNELIFGGARASLFTTDRWLDGPAAAARILLLDLRKLSVASAVLQMTCAVMIQLMFECYDVALTGTEQFSRYSGYSDTYRWDGNHNDQTLRDEWQRKCTEIVAIDALHYRNFLDQFHPENMKRELNKAYCGFVRPGVQTENLSAVATGNWGCGAFGGDKRLKAVLQMMAAAEAERDLMYFTFIDTDLLTDVHHIHTLITQSHATVGYVFGLLRQYYERVCKETTRGKPQETLYGFLVGCFLYSDVTVCASIKPF